MLILSNFLPIWKDAQLKQRLRGKLTSEGASAEVRDGLFVGLCPDAGPRIYKGNWSWDIGFLCLSKEYLQYWGEEARFTLRREQMKQIGLAPGPRWLVQRSIGVHSLD